MPIDSSRPGLARFVDMNPPSNFRLEPKEQSKDECDERDKMNVMKEISRLNERELELNIVYTASWHAEYRNSAYIFIGNVDMGLSEGDLICVFSQFGEVVDVNIVRDEKTGRSKGFAFLAYEDQRSTVLAIDNMNSYSLLGRQLRVDHAERYRRPKKLLEGEQAGEKIFDPEGDKEYDERRKRIWDYELYSSQAPSISAPPPSAPLSTIPEAARQGAPPDFRTFTSADMRPAEHHTKQTNRVLELLAAKQKQRALQGSADGQSAAHTQTTASRSQFGDQPIVQDSHKHKRHDKKHKHHKHRSRSRSRDHHTHSRSRSPRTDSSKRRQREHRDNKERSR